MKDGGPAFPHESPMEIFSGMSLRDYFAGQVIERCLSLTEYPTGTVDHAAAALAAYMIADQMIEARRPTLAAAMNTAPPPDDTPLCGCGHTAKKHANGVGTCVAYVPVDDPRALGSGPPGADQHYCHCDKFTLAGTADYPRPATPVTVSVDDAEILF